MAGPIRRGGCDLGELLIILDVIYLPCVIALVSGHAITCSPVVLPRPYNILRPCKLYLLVPALLQDSVAPIGVKRARRGETQAMHISKWALE